MSSESDAANASSPKKGDFSSIRTVRLPYGGESFAERHRNLDWFRQCLEKGDFTYIPLLSESGIHVDDVSTSSGPALVRAISDFNTAAVEHLLDAGASPTAAPFVAKTLQCVLQNPSSINIFHARSITRLLLSHGASPSELDPDVLEPLPPIFLAAKAAVPDIVVALSDSGAELSVVDAYGGSPLHYVYSVPFDSVPDDDHPFRKRTFETLCSLGLSPSAKDNNGKTPLDVARENGWTI